MLQVHPFAPWREPGDVARDRSVEIEHAVAPQQSHTGGHELLRERSDVEDRVAAERFSRRDVRRAHPVAEPVVWTRSTDVDEDAWFSRRDPGEDPGILDAVEEHR